MKYLLLLFSSFILTSKALNKRDLDQCKQSYITTCEIIDDCDLYFFDLKDHIENDQNDDCQYIKDNNQQFLDDQHLEFPQEFYNRFHSCLQNFINEQEAPSLQHQYYASIYHCAYPDLLQNIVRTQQDDYHPPHFIKDDIVVTEQTYSTCMGQVSVSCGFMCLIGLQSVCGSLLSMDRCSYVIDLQGMYSDQQWPYQVRHDFHYCYNQCIQLIEMNNNPSLSDALAFVQATKGCGGEAPQLTSEQTNNNANQTDTNTDNTFNDHIYTCSKTYNNNCKGDCYIHTQNKCINDDKLFYSSNCIQSRYYTESNDNITDSSEQNLTLSCLQSCLLSLDHDQAVEQSQIFRQCVEEQYQFPEIEEEEEEQNNSNYNGDYNNTDNKSTEENNQKENKEEDQNQNQNDENNNPEGKKNSKNYNLNIHSKNLEFFTGFLLLLTLCINA